MSITVAQVNELRNLTGAGIMDCKKALTESGGDIQKAIDYLRKKGAKVAELRAGRAASEGVIIAKTTADHSRGVIVYLSCETDFVAKNEDFRSFAAAIADVALNQNIQSIEALLNTSINGTSVKDQIQEKVSAIGELIAVSALETLEGVSVVAYNHMGNKIGVLVALNHPHDEAVESAGKDVAMQVAAMNPLAVDGSGVPQEILERERNIAREKALAQGKPEHILDKIAEGAVNTFIKENTLLTQPFVKDGSKTVAQFLGSVKSGLTVTGFKRVALGVK
ncbi:MAG: translation elongation factor Ts [Chitinophagales bacterium]|nr:translation elongation factor Ts [Chitinophagales bacterium]MDW8273970.1 translation elongation factor Ts [Chitinophagales bacterium]